MLPVGVHEGGPVLRDAPEAFGRIRAGIPLDRVQGQVEPAGTVHEAHALLQQPVHLGPAIYSGAGLWTVLQPSRRRPARRVCGDLLGDGLGEAVPEVPPVCDLDGAALVALEQSTT
ncbi:hypothetical protein GCM10012320_32960 [Sinomonas cellulolyticus]|nr:hypothetical protein GCM10012320_32960 [Sinomonas sp. KCTC 49339]